MSNPRLRKARRWREIQRRRSKAGVEARERKRLERAKDAECVGTITFEGQMFGGRHEMRLLLADWFDDRKMMVEIDGEPHRRWGFDSRFGRSTVRIDCPFCGETTKAYLWSLAGSGKKCQCGAKHTHYDVTLPPPNTQNDGGKQ